MVRSAGLVASLCLFAIACDGVDDSPAQPFAAARDAGHVLRLADAASLASQQPPPADAGTDAQDSATLSGANAPDTGTVVGDAGQVDAGRIAPTSVQIDKWFVPTCGDTCHNAVTTGAFGNGNDLALPILFAGVRQVQDATSSCDRMPYLVAGKPEQSYLYLALTAQSPCEQHAPVEGFGKVELQLLSDWIAGGAK